MRNLDLLDWSTLVLVIVGAVNWGLVGIGQLANLGGDTYNLVNILLGSYPDIEAAFYLLVGLAGLYQIYFGVQLYED